MVDRIALITALIVDRPMCLSCLVLRSAMAMDETLAILELIEGALPVCRNIGHCRACGRDGPTVSVTQPAV